MTIMTHHNTKQNDSWLRPTRDSGTGLRKAPPLVKTDLTPDKIVCKVLNIKYDKEMYQDYVYQSIIDMMQGYRKSRIEWEEYRLKVEPMLLNKWGEILRECQTYGFLAPEIKYEDKLRYLEFKQIIQKVNLGNKKFPQEQLERM